MKKNFLILIENVKNISGDTSMLVIGTVVANSFPILLQPFLKRIYSPESFGTYDVYLKIFAILVAISTLKYENAIIIAKKDSESRHTLYLSISLGFLFSVFVFVIVMLFKELILNKFPINTTILIILPFSVFFYSLFNSCNIFLLKHKMFFLSSTNKVARRSSEGVIQTLLGYFKYSSGLIIGDLVGNISQGIFSLWKVNNLIKN